MNILQKQPAYRQRRPSTSLLLDSNWQPIGPVVRRLMQRHGLPMPTAIAQVEAFGMLTGSADTGQSPRGGRVV